MASSVFQLASPLRPDDQDLSPEAKTQVETCRLLSLFGAVLLLVLGGLRALFPLNAADPIWTCFAAAGLFAGLFAATYAAPLARRYCTPATIGLFALVLAWSVVVAVLNRFSGEYAVGLLLVYAVLIVAAGLPRQSPTTVWWLAGLGPLLTVIGLALGPPPQTRPLVVLGCMATAGLGAGLAMQAHLSIRAHLREREERLRAITENVSEGIYRSSTDEGLVYVNQTFADLFGYDSVAEVLHINPDSLYPNPDVRQRLRKEVQGKDSFDQVEVEFQRKDGSTFVGLMSGSVVRDEDGEVEYYDGAIIDITDRKAAERAVQEERDRLETLFEGLSTPVVRCMANGRAPRIEEVNDAFEEVFGMSPAEAEGKPLDALVKADESVNMDRQALVDGAVMRDVRCRAAEGTRDFRIQMAGRQPEEGAPEGHAIFTDITEQKRREEALQRQNELFAMAQDLADVGALEYDVKTDELTWTDEVYRIHEVPNSFEPTRDKVIEFYHPEDRPRIRDMFARALEEGESYTAELRLITDEENHRWVRTRGNPQTSNGEVVRLRGSIQDITERKRRERAVQEANATLEAILENLPLGVLAEGADRSVLVANQSFCDLLGLPASAADLRGQDAARVTTRTSGLFADPGAFSRRTQEIVERGTPVSEEELVLADGRILERDFVPYELEEGRAALWVYRDITERKEREQRLKEAKEEAEEANRMKSVFLANMSHEIRTPLTSIIGFAEAIGDEAEAEREGPILRFAELIEKSGNRLLETLDAVLNLSKLEAGEMGLSPEPISLAEEIEEMGNLFGPRADEEEIDLQIDGSDESLWVQADPGGLRIALRNLISNAIKYTEAGGCVWVRTRATGGRVVLEVEDTGIGMDPGEASALFEAFRQGSEGVSREYEGSGLGLAVTKRVLNQMDGTIDLETEKGEGTCFTVTLPPAEVEDPEAALES